MPPVSLRNASKVIEDAEPDQGNEVYLGDGPQDGPVPLENLVDTMFLKSQRTGIDFTKILTVFLVWAKPYVRQQIRKWMDEHPFIKEFETQFQTQRRTAEDCATFIAWLKQWAEDEPEHDGLFLMPTPEADEDEVEAERERQWLLRQPTLILGEPEEFPDEAEDDAFAPQT